MFGGSAWNAAQGSGWLDRRGYQPLVATSQMLKIDFLKIHQLTWIIVRDELMCVLFASFSVGVLVLVPVGCLRVIPGKVQIKTLMNIRCKVALQTEMDTTTKFLDSAKNQ